MLLHTGATAVLGLIMGLQRQVLANHDQEMEAVVNVIGRKVKQGFGGYPSATPGPILAVSGSVEELFSILENAGIIARMAQLG